MKAATPDTPTPREAWLAAVVLDLAQGLCPLVTEHLLECPEVNGLGECDQHGDDAKLTACWLRAAAQATKTTGGE